LKDPGVDAAEQTLRDAQQGQTSLEQDVRMEIGQERREQERARYNEARYLREEQRQIELQASSARLETIQGLSRAKQAALNEPDPTKMFDTYNSQSDELFQSIHPTINDPEDAELYRIDFGQLTLANETVLHENLRAKQAAIAGQQIATYLELSHKVDSWDDLDTLERNMRKLQSGLATDTGMPDPGAEGAKVLQLRQQGALAILYNKVERGVSGSLDEFQGAIDFLNDPQFIKRTRSEDRGTAKKVVLSQRSKAHLNKYQQVLAGDDWRTVTNELIDVLSQGPDAILQYPDNSTLRNALQSRVKGYISAANSDLKRLGFENGTDNSAAAADAAFAYEQGQTSGLSAEESARAEANLSDEVVEGQPKSPAAMQNDLAIAEGLAFLTRTGAIPKPTSSRILNIIHKEGADPLEVAAVLQNLNDALESGSGSFKGDTEGWANLSEVLSVFNQTPNFTPEVRAKNVLDYVRDKKENPPDQSKTGKDWRAIYATPSQWFSGESLIDNVSRDITWGQSQMLEAIKGDGLMKSIWKGMTGQISSQGIPIEKGFNPLGSQEGKGWPFIGRNMIDLVPSEILNELVYMASELAARGVRLPFQQVAVEAQARGLGWDPVSERLQWGSMHRAGSETHITLPTIAGVTASGMVIPGDETEVGSWAHNNQAAAEQIVSDDFIEAAHVSGVPELIPLAMNLSHALMAFRPFTSGIEPDEQPPPASPLHPIGFFTDALNKYYNVNPQNPDDRDLTFTIYDQNGEPTIFTPDVSGLDVRKPNAFIVNVLAQAAAASGVPQLGEDQIWIAMNRGWNVNTTGEFETSYVGARELTRPGPPGVGNPLNAVLNAETDRSVASDTSGGVPSQEIAYKVKLVRPDGSMWDARTSRDTDAIYVVPAIPRSPVIAQHLGLALRRNELGDFSQERMNELGITVQGTMGPLAKMALNDIGQTVANSSVYRFAVQAITERPARPETSAALSLHAAALDSYDWIVKRMAAEDEMGTRLAAQGEEIYNSDVRSLIQNGPPEGLLNREWTGFETNHPMVHGTDEEGRSTVSNVVLETFHLRDFARLTKPDRRDSVLGTDPGDAYILLPSMVDGEYLSGPKEILEMAVENGIANHPIFRTKEDARIWAERHHSNIEENGSWNWTPDQEPRWYQLAAVARSAELNNQELQQVGPFGEQDVLNEMKADFIQMRDGSGRGRRENWIKTGARIVDKYKTRYDGLYVEYQQRIRDGKDPLTNEAVTIEKGETKSAVKKEMNAKLKSFKKHYMTRMEIFRKRLRNGQDPLTGVSEFSDAAHPRAFPGRPPDKPTQEIYDAEAGLVETLKKVPEGQ
jgi:hypothetical protein